MSSKEYLATCIDCGREFEAQSKNARRCKPCRDKRANEVRRRPQNEQRACAFCGKDFTPAKSDAVYCSDECRYQANLSKKRRPDGSTPESDRVDRISVVLETIRERKQIQYAPLRGLKHDTSGRAWIGHSSDWHIGQQTLSEETGGLYFHSYEIARAQLERKAAIEREIIRDSGRTVGNYLMVMNGDLLEGDDMRASQHREIEMLASEQAVEVFNLVCWDIDAHLEMVEGQVVVSFVGGNHDRLSKKPGNAGLGELGYKATYAWMVGEFVRAAYANNPRVKVINWATWYGHLKFAGQRIAHSHGADVKWTTGGHSGIPWNAIHVAAQRYARMLGGFDLLFMGHGHIPAVLPLEPSSSVFLNGSLPGTTAWVQSSFKAIRTPVQQLVEVNRHGFVAYHPLWLDVGQTTPNAAIWDESIEVDAAS